MAEEEFSKFEWLPMTQLVYSALQSVQTTASNSRNTAQALLSEGTDVRVDVASYKLFDLRYEQCFHREYRIGTGNQRQEPP